MEAALSRSEHPGFTSSSNLLMEICGRPPLFSPEQQQLNWLLVFASAVYILSAVANIFSKIPFVVPLFAFAAIYIAFYYLRRFTRTSAGLIANATFTVNSMALILGWLTNNGIEGSVVFFFLSTVVSAMGVFRGRQRVFWTSLTLALFGGLFWMQTLHAEWIVPYPSTAIGRQDLAFSFLLVALYTVGYVGLNAYNLSERRKVADSLLLNILPVAVAERLKYSPAATVAEDHPSVSVLFADIVDFTPLSATMTPEDLVALLNSVFSYFDSLIDKYGVEKIKTIGDSYMVAAGVPTDNPDHAAALIRLALEMRDYVAVHSFRGRTLRIRIGVHSGSVVAGVIGHKKFSYDLWGDAVNMASRMESHGQAGVVQITRNTYELIKDSFACEPKGIVDVKGKGPTEVWHVVAPAT
jgi:adenylate cyclase